MQRQALIALMALSACAPMDQDEKLDQYLREQLEMPAEKQPEVIICIAEQGCPVCSRAFADMVRPFITAPNCLVLVRATGSSVDLTGLLRESSTIRHDNDGEFRALGLLEGSGLILLKEGRIDTIISVRTAGIEQQLGYMRSILEASVLNPL